MKSSDSLISTVKEAPNDAQIISHQLMIRAGLISKLASGIYSYLPFGLKVIQKVEKIIREEMNKSKALELLMPVAQPAEIWQESKRWEEYGPELLRFKDRHDRDFCLGPTHEEVITNIAKQYLRSYKQLPINFYQIQTKFRDEIRPRFGVMRSREFIMKDAYSFHIDEKSLGETYQIMHQTYCNIFDRIGFNYRAVLADSGAIGGESSHEFHVLADSGEDAICFSDKSDYAANIERAETLPQEKPKPAKEALELVKTPGVKTINDVCNLLKIKPTNSIKTLIVEGDDDNLVALVLRGDHELNEVKAAKIQGVKQPLQMAEEGKVQKQLGCAFGSIGVVNLDIPIIADCDTGFGGPANVSHAVKKYEKAGIAGMSIEDKIFPKQNSLLENSKQELLPEKEFVAKIIAARESKVEKKFMIIARTEALIAEKGMDEAIRRAKAYENAGADAILIHSKKNTPDEIFEFSNQWDGKIPLVVVPTSYPSVKVNELISHKIKMIIYANQSLRVAHNSMSKLLKEIIQKESMDEVNINMSSMNDIFKLQEMYKITDQEKIVENELKRMGYIN